MYFVGKLLHFLSEVGTYIFGMNGPSLGRDVARMITAQTIESSVSMHAECSIAGNSAYLGDGGGLQAPRVLDFDVPAVLVGNIVVGEALIQALQRIG